MTDQYKHRRQPQNEGGKVLRYDQEEGIISVSESARSRSQRTRFGGE